MPTFSTQTSLPNLETRVTRSTGWPCRTPLHDNGPQHFAPGARVPDYLIDWSNTIEDYLAETDGDLEAETMRFNFRGMSFQIKPLLARVLLLDLQALRTSAFVGCVGALGQARRDQAENVLHGLARSPWEDAMFDLSTYYTWCREWQTAYDIAVDLLSKNNPGAFYLLADWYLARDNPDRDQERALNMLRRGRARKQLRCCRLLSKLEDESKWIAWRRRLNYLLDREFRRSILSGDLDSFYHV